MKTLRITFASLLTIGLVSCGPYYRVVTSVDRDGSTMREIYAHGDSAYMAGNEGGNNPFLFTVGSQWDVTRLTNTTARESFGAREQVNAMISRQANSISDYSESMDCSADKRSYAAPTESITDRFRWLYTDHYFEATYHKLEVQIPIPISDYLTPEEQMIWTQGSQGHFQGMNGVELNSMLDDIEGKFSRWHARNCFEVNLRNIAKLAQGYTFSEGDANLIFEMLYQKGADNMDAQSVCGALDGFYKTSYFAHLGREHSSRLADEFESASSFLDLIGTTINYELVLPGALLSSNSASISADTLSWKIDGMRILADDYRLTAEYRTMNIWSFVVTGLALMVIIICAMIWWRRRYKPI